MAEKFTEGVVTCITYGVSGGYFLVPQLSVILPRALLRKQRAIMEKSVCGSYLQHLMKL